MLKKIKIMNLLFSGETTFLHRVNCKIRKAIICRFTTGKSSADADVSIKNTKCIKIEQPAFFCRPYHIEKQQLR